MTPPLKYRDYRVVVQPEISPWTSTWRDDKRHRFKTFDEAKTQDECDSAEIVARERCKQVMSAINKHLPEECESVDWEVIIQLKCPHCQGEIQQDDFCEDEEDATKMYYACCGATEPKECTTH